MHWLGSSLRVKIKSLGVGVFGFGFVVQRFGAKGSGCNVKVQGLECEVQREGQGACVQGSVCIG